MLNKVGIKRAPLRHWERPGSTGALLEWKTVHKIASRGGLEAGGGGDRPLRHTLGAREPSPPSCLPSLIRKMGHSDVLKRLEIKTSKSRPSAQRSFPFRVPDVVLAAGPSPQTECAGAGMSAKETRKSSRTEACVRQTLHWIAWSLHLCLSLCLCLLDTRTFTTRTTGWKQKLWARKEEPANRAIGRLTVIATIDLCGLTRSLLAARVKGE